ESLPGRPAIRCPSRRAPAARRWCRRARAGACPSGRRARAPGRRAAACRRTSAQYGFRQVSELERESRYTRQVPITPPRRGYQPYDGLITADDLPEGWYLPDRFPGEREDDASNEIDALLGYDDSLVTDEQRESQALSDENETVDG